MSSFHPPQEEIESSNQSSGGSAAVSQKRKHRTDDTSHHRIAVTYQRRKSANACLVCRARKTKCDNARPICGFCAKTSGDCIYVQPGSQRFDQASLAILERLDRVEEMLAKQQQHRHCCVHPPCDDPSCSELQHPVHRGSYATESRIPRDAQPIWATSPDGPTPENSDGRPFSDLNTTPDQYATKLQSLLDIPPSSAALSRATAEMGIEAMLQWPVLQGHLRQLDISPAEPVELLSQVSSRVDPSVRRRNSFDLDHETIQRLVGNFLDNNNKKNPIIDPFELRRDAKDFVDSSCACEQRVCRLLLALAVSSISVSLSEQNGRRHIHISRDSPEFHAAENYFQAAQRYTGSVYCENSLISAQCAFLSGLYLSYTMRIMAAWKEFVQASTQCVGLYMSRRLLRFAPGLETRDKMNTIIKHRDASSSNTRALEGSLYWSCLKSEVELRLELGLPGSGIDSVPYPHVFPSLPTFNLYDTDDQSLSPGVQPSAAEADRDSFTTAWFFYLGEIALKRLLYRIISYRYENGSNGSNHRGNEAESLDDDSSFWDRVTEFDMQLRQWTEFIPPPVGFSPTSTEPLHDVLPWVLRGHRIDVIEILRFPAISAILDPNATLSKRVNSMPPHQQHRQSDQYSETTIRMAKGYLANAVQRIETNAEGLLHRHQGSWLTARTTTRSALALLAMKLHCQSERGSEWNADLKLGGHGSGASQTASLGERILPPRWRHCVVLVISVLKAWEVESPDLGQLRLILEGLLALCHG